MTHSDNSSDRPGDERRFDDTNSENRDDHPIGSGVGTGAGATAGAIAGSVAGALACFEVTRARETAAPS